MEWIQTFKTNDGKIFEDETEASNHEHKINLANKTIKLLDSNDLKISKDLNKFSNAEGYVIVDENNYQKARLLISNLLEITNQSGYLITSRACSEDNNKNKYIITYTFKKNGATKCIKQHY